MRTKVFYNLPEESCYGCQACAQICPVSAIEMKEDKEGFLFPIIDSSKCIECNLCEKSCTTQDRVLSPLLHSLPEKVDAAWELDIQSRLESTSGGLFYIIGEKWIKSGGIVYGADFDENLKVVHKRVSNIEGLKRLRGSKYVQSDITGILRSVKEDLKMGEKVLFSGTPCQVGGLRAFLKRDYPNLVCIDLVCHGVPSPKIFKEHLRYVETTIGKKLIDYKFRSKDKAGWRSYIKYIFQDYKYKKSTLGNEFYALNFYSSNFNRKSCFSCQYSRPERVGDITLSDFWNAEKYNKSLRLQRKYGFNMVMCNTEIGKQVYDTVRGDIETLSLPVDVALKGDVRLRHPECAPLERDSLFNDYYSHGYEWLIKNRTNKPSGISRFIPLCIKNLINEIKARL